MALPFLIARRILHQHAAESKRLNFGKFRKNFLRRQMHVSLCLQLLLEEERFHIRNVESRVHCLKIKRTRLSSHMAKLALRIYHLD